MSTDAKSKKKEVDFEAERRQRLELEALDGALARKRCPRCTIVGAWDRYDKDRQKGRVHYIKCKACGWNDHVPVIIKEQP